MKALCWEPRPEGLAACRLCRHGCLLKPDKRGLCGVRRNDGGTLRTLVPDVVSAAHLDPVEKKPLYHFLPGTHTFSVGSVGCNFACDFCQNHEISREPARSGRIDGSRVPPDALVAEARRLDAASMAFTYNEPTVFFEFLYATAALARAADLPCILVSNGYAGEDCLTALRPYIRAANIDLKAFRDAFYRDHCKARLQPVLDNLKIMASFGWWLEVTTLLIPGCNDDTAELRDMAQFLREELGPHVPWHLSRFHGAYQMRQHPPTPAATMIRAWELAREEGILFPYVGNMRGGVGTSTLCPQCGALCALREGFQVRLAARGGRCPGCGALLPGVWEGAA